MNKMTFEKAKEMLEENEQYVFNKEVAIEIDTILQLLIEKNIFTKQEYEDVEKKRRKYAEKKWDKEIRKKVDEFNEEMKDPLNQVRAMLGTLK